MDNCKELIDKYNQDYRLDKETKQKAEELFNEYINKKQNASSVSILNRNFKSRILMSIPYHLPPSFLFDRILISLIIVNGQFSSCFNEKRDSYCV